MKENKLTFCSSHLKNNTLALALFNMKASLFSGSSVSNLCVVVLFLEHCPSPLWVQAYLSFKRRLPWFPQAELVISSCAFWTDFYSCSCHIVIICLEFCLSQSVNASDIKASTLYPQGQAQCLEQGKLSIYICCTELNQVQNDTFQIQ